MGKSMVPFAINDNPLPSSCSLLAMLCALPSDDFDEINSIKNVNKIVKCDISDVYDIEFFQLVLENDELKPVFDIGIDFIKVGWFGLNAALCLPPAVLIAPELCVASCAAAPHLCVLTYLVDAPNLYNEVQEDLENVGVYLLDVIEGSVIIPFAVQSNQSIVDIMTAKIEAFKGSKIVIVSEEYGNVSLGIDYLVDLQNDSFHMHTTKDTSNDMVMQTTSPSVDRSVAAVNSINFAYILMLCVVFVLF